MSGILRSVRLHDSCGDYQVGDVEKAYLSSMSESCIVSFTIKYVNFSLLGLNHSSSNFELQIFKITLCL